MKIFKMLLVGICALTLLGVVSGCGAKKEEKKPLNNDTQKEELEGELNVFAAASLKISFEEIIDEFKKQNPKLDVKLNTDGSDKLYNQMKEGAEADIYVSASQKWMKEAVKDGIIKKEDQKPLLNNQVVMIKNIKAPDKKLKDIKDGKDLCLGAESVPVGRYSKQYFEKTNQWENLKNDTSFEPKVTDVVKKVAQGARNYGLVYKTDANSEIKNKTIEVTDKIPEDSGIKVIYPIGIVKNSKNRKAAIEFEKFLGAGIAKDILEDVGFVFIAN